MEFKFYPTMCDGWILQTVSSAKSYSPFYHINSSSAIDFPKEIADISGFFCDLIPGSLTIAFEDCLPKQTVKIVRMALPVNDIYIIQMHISQYSGSFFVDGQEAISEEIGKNIWFFSSTTVPFSYTAAPNNSFKNLSVCISRGYLIELMHKLDLAKESEWWDVLNNNDRFCNAFDLLLSDLKMVEEIVDLFVHSCDSNSLNIYLLKLNVQKLIVLFLERIFRKESKENLGLNKIDYNKIQKVAQMMRKELHKKYSLGELSKECGMSLSKFKKLFKIIMHKSFSEYYFEIRMQQALHFLKGQEPENMTEIAFKLGYKDQSQLSKAFKEYFGYSPTQFVKNSMVVKNFVV